jgi:hypothetical protein
MIDIRIVCTHDAMKVAEILVRLLEAEQHVVRLTCGRQAYHDLEAAKDTDEAVILIWSPAAPMQEYVLAWAERTDPQRLIEIARAPGAPKIARVAPVIEFAQWRGERGGRAWNALNDRLRTVSRMLEPAAPPPRYAVMALGAAGLVAIGGAFIVRINDVATPAQQVATAPATLPFSEATGIGGAVEFIEPASVDDMFALPRLPSRIAPLTPQAHPSLYLVEPYEPAEIRDPTLLERLRDINPLRDRDDDTSDS